MIRAEGSESDGCRITHFLEAQSGRPLMMAWQIAAKADGWLTPRLDVDDRTDSRDAQLLGDYADAAAQAVLLMREWGGPHAAVDRERVYIHESEGILPRQIGYWLKEKRFEGDAAVVLTQGMAMSAPGQWGPPSWSIRTLVGLDSRQAVDYTIILSAAKIAFEEWLVMDGRPMKAEGD